MAAMVVLSGSAGFAAGQVALPSYEEGNRWVYSADMTYSPGFVLNGTLEMRIADTETVSVGSTVYDTLRNEVIGIFQEISVVTLPGLSAAMRFTAGVVRAFVGGIQIAAIEFRVFAAEAVLQSRFMVVKFTEDLVRLLDAIGSFSQKTGDGLTFLSNVPGAIGNTFNVARKADLDPELALRRTIHKFRRRFGVIEAELGEELRDAPLDVMEALWRRAADAESSAG